MLRRPETPALARSGQTQPRRSWFFRYRLPSIIIGCAILIAAGAYIYNSPLTPQQAGGGRWRGGGEGPVPILAAAATTADVPVYLDGVGTTRALNTVTVKPQVDGKLMSVNFKEGQDVEK